MTTATAAAPTNNKPKHKDFRRPIVEILADLALPVPERLIQQRQQGKASLSYIPWYSMVRLLDYYAPGWQGEVKNVYATPDRLYLTYSLNVFAEEGIFTREATGTELLKEEYLDKETKTKKIREMAYGDPSSNAESMAFRRAAAKFGLGLSLYDKEL